MDREIIDEENLLLVDDGKSTAQTGIYATDVHVY
jgi:hypothetical protein